MSTSDYTAQELETIDIDFGVFIPVDTDHAALIEELLEYDLYWGGGDECWVDDLDVVIVRGLKRDYRKWMAESKFGPKDAKQVWNERQAA